MKDLYGGVTRAARDVEPAVAQGRLRAQRGAVVPVEVTPAPLWDKVETAVELDDEAESAVEDVGELVAYCTLPNSGRQRVAALDVIR